MKFLLRDAFYCLLLAFLFIASISYIILNLSIFNPFTSSFKDFSFLDLYYSEKMYSPRYSENIVLVNIEQKNRFQIAQLIRKINQEKPKVVGVDVMFREKKDSYADSLLSIQLLKNNVVTTKAFISNELLENDIQFKTNNAFLGYSNINFNNDSGVIRTFEGLKKINNEQHVSFPTLIALKYLDKNLSFFEKKIQDPIQINYSGSLNNFINYSYDEFINTPDVSFIKDKIVLVGYLGTPHKHPFDIEDAFFTPLNPISTGKSTPDMYGVVLHANIIQMLIDQNFLYEFSNLQTMLVTGILSYVILILLIVLSIKHPASFMLSKKLTHLLLTILFLWFTLFLYKNRILLQPEKIIAIVIISVEFIGVYKIICHKLNIKYKWKSYFYS